MGPRLVSCMFLAFFVHSKVAANVGNATQEPKADVFLETSALPQTDMDIIMQQTTYYNGLFLDQFKPECQAYAALLENKTDFVRAIIDINGELTPNQACYRTLACNFTTGEENSCPPVIDALGTCFPETPGGALANASCPASINKIKYRTADNVYKRCLPTGTWEPRSNYSFCKPMPDEGLPCTGLDSSIGSPTSSKGSQDSVEPSCERNLFRLAIVSYVGRGISLATLIMTFIIFWALRSIRCWRIIIHWNLTASLILFNFSWILLHLFVSYESMTDNTVFCRFLLTLFNYTHITNYFWCFAEGLYLHMMVVLAYTHDRFKLTTYMVVGWVVPIPIIGVWVAVKIAFQDSNCWIPRPHTDSLNANYFLHVPTIFVLVVNAFILANIVRILFTKLRSRGRSDDRGRDYLKAAKAALILLPMLGFTYIIFLINPAPGTTGELIFYYVNTFLQSFQGLFVCVIFCFANGEVQTAVRKALRSWRHHHSIPCYKGGAHKRRFSSMSLSRSINNTQTFRLSHRSQNDCSFSAYPNNNKRFNTEVSLDEATVTQCHLVSDGDVAFCTLGGGSKGLDDVEGRFQAENAGQCGK